MNKPYPVGTIVRLKIPCMNNAPGALGIVYEQYSTCNDTVIGSSVIFENMAYDGFSYPDEQKLCFEFVGYSFFHSTYKFSSVLQLEKDWFMGYWKGVFENYKVFN